MNTNSSALLTGDGAAQRLNISRRTLDTWRTRNFGPKYLKIGKSVRYRISDLDSWMESQERSHTHDTPTGEVE